MLANESLKEKVKQTLFMFPDARDNDAVLCLRFWEDFQDTPRRDFMTLNYNLGQDKLKRLTSPRTITRLRQQIQNEEKLLIPSQEGRERREKLRKDWLAAQQSLDERRE